MSLHSRWTTVILHVTSFIYRKKGSLLTAHALSAFWTVITLIAAEIFLAIISVPLYLVAAPVSEKGESNEVKQYRTRRVLTLSVLTALCIIWVIKLVFILGVSLLFDPRASYSIQETKMANEELQTVIPKVVLAPVDSAESVASIGSVYQDSEGDIIAEGTAAPDRVVVVSFVGAHERTPRLKLYAGVSDAQGHWKIEEDREVFMMPKGEYTASAMTYDEGRNIKSGASQPQVFETRELLGKRIFAKADWLLNILTIGFLVIGIFAALLTL